PCGFIENQYLTNLDYVQSDKAKVAVRYFDARSDESYPLGGANSAVGVAPGFAVNKFQVGSIGYSYVFSPRVFNEFRAHLFKTLADFGKTSNVKYSDLGVSAPTALINEHPIIAIRGSYTLGTAALRTQPQQTWGFYDNISMVQ